ncbi:MAG TPA: hypothetical protein EYP24_00385 [bacterium (Candidatus Stahlbacteria)]|nr:hypothetical protein [Candidatus Stahlbacteria bacterium]
MEIKGIVEGFYGPPYRWEERESLIEFFPQLGFNYYLYAPKSDPYTRKDWRRLYPDRFLKRLERFASICLERRIILNYGFTPGGDIDSALTRLNQIRSLGIREFSLLFDDLKVKIDEDLAKSQVEITNTIFKRLNPDRLLFCPTQYCGKISSYLKVLSKKLNPEIIILWTGPEVVSTRITTDHIQRIAGYLKRRIVLWDNYPVNDYDPVRIFLGPFQGREPEILNLLTGYLANPMNQARLSLIPLFTLAEFFKKKKRYQPQRAIRKFLSQFGLTTHYSMVSQFFPSRINLKMSPETGLLKRRDFQRLIPIIETWQEFDLFEAAWAVKNLILARDLLLSWIKRRRRKGLRELKYSLRREGEIYFENQVRDLILTGSDNSLRLNYEDQ